MNFMSVICSKCGHELPDGAKFCGSCGNKIEAQKSEGLVCKTCGSPLKVGAKFCGVCGSSASAVQPVAEAKADPNPTMDELTPPVITDATFANDQMTNRHEGDPTIDAVEVDNAPTPTPAPVPTPAPTPTPTPAPAQPTYNNVPNQETTVLNQGQYQNMYGTQNQAVNNANAYSNQNPQYQPYPDPAQNPTKQGKGGGVVLPIILIILILGVIAVDVFVLFPDRIFGSDDTSKAKNDIVTDVGDVDVGNIDVGDIKV